MKAVLFFLAIAFPALPISTAGEPAQYHGNRESRIFPCRHFNCGNCMADFQDRNTAIAAGYRPCKVCKP